MKKTKRIKKEEVTAEISYAESQIELMIDLTLEDSFPASDPPSWTLGREEERSLSQTKAIESAPNSSLLQDAFLRRL